MYDTDAVCFRSVFIEHIIYCVNETPQITAGLQKHTINGKYTHRLTEVRTERERQTETDRQTDGQTMPCST